MKKTDIKEKILKIKCNTSLLKDNVIDFIEDKLWGKCYDPDDDLIEVLDTHRSELFEGYSLLYIDTKDKDFIQVCIDVDEDEYKNPILTISKKDICDIEEAIDQLLDYVYTILMGCLLENISAGNFCGNIKVELE